MAHVRVPRVNVTFFRYFDTKINLACKGCWSKRPIRMGDVFLSVEVSHSKFARKQDSP